MKTHYDANGKGLYQPGYPECGQGNAKVTTKIEHVTCLKCKKTEYFKKNDPIPQKSNQDI